MRCICVQVVATDERLIARLAGDAVDPPKDELRRRQ
jgi:hypothetical protein